MKKYVLSLIKFAIVFCFIYAIGFVLPSTPKANHYYLHSKVTKDSLLNKVKSPRLIFLSGSSGVFGLNSQLFKDSLSINPVNASLTSPLGLVYILKNALPKIKKGDIVILAPEYDHYFNGFGYGNLDLTRMIFDVNFDDIKNLEMKQWIRLIKTSPRYFVSKFNPNEYFGYNKKSVYTLNIFNEYGDSSYHWKFSRRSFKPAVPLKNKFDNSVIKKIVTFNDAIEKKGGVMYISYPPYDEDSFNNNSDRIAQVIKALKDNKLKVLGTPEHYKFSKKYMFDTPYHLTKEGVDLRTNNLIEDYFNFIKK